MAKILAFAGSNSSTSINYKLVEFTANNISGHEIQLLNMAHFPFPMYSADYESANGYSNSLVELKNDIQKSNGLILSVNEHNGNPSGFFKNLLDWLSRLERNFMTDTKVLLMGTSPGRGGAKNAMNVVEKMLPFFDGTLTATFSLPSFNHNFSLGQGISDAALAKEHEEAVKQFLNAL